MCPTETPLGSPAELAGQGRVRVRTIFQLQESSIQHKSILIERSLLTRTRCGLVPDLAGGLAFSQDLSGVACNTNLELLEFFCSEELCHLASQSDFTLAYLYTPFWFSECACCL